MYFEDSSDKASCPYNKSHVFDKQKLIYHINRCKDKLKEGHKYASCQYNRIHIVLKQQIEYHQNICPDREDVKKLTQQLKQSQIQADRIRERSREKVAKQEIQRQGQLKRQVKNQHHHQSDYVVLQNCPLCQPLIQKLQQIKSVVSEQVLSKIKKVQKLMKMNTQYIVAQQSLKKRIQD